DRDRATGFFCLDRSPGEPSFTRADIAFLLMAGRLCASPSENGSKPRVVPSVDSPVLEWPSFMGGRSKPVRGLWRQPLEAAATDGNVVVVGKSGTGKEVAAQLIHELSGHAQGPFIAQNCAAVTESLADTEIFGYAANSGIHGAERDGSPGWFELAHKGTLLL